MKRWVPTLLALAVLAALAVWVVRFETKPKEEKKDRPWTVKTEDIVRFDLEDLAKGTRLNCEKQKDGGWWITAPGRLEADGELVDQVLKHLASPEVERKLSAPADLRPFGLLTPSFRASFTDKAGKARVLLVGTKNPGDSAYYVLPQGTSTPYTVAVWSVDGFRKTGNDLRQKALIALDPAKVTRIVLRRAKVTPGTLEFARAGDGWQITKPVSAAADRYAIDGLLNDLKALKGGDVLEEPQAYSRYKLDQPGFTVVVYTGSGTGDTVYLSKPIPNKDEAYASSTRLPFTFRLPGAWVLQNLGKGLDDYRERLLLQADKEGLAAAEFAFGGLTVKAIRGRKGKWTITEPAKSSADTELQDALFEAVYVRIESFVEDAPKSLKAYGLEPARATVTIRGTRDGKPFTAEYKLGNRSGDTVYLQFGASPPVYGVRKDLLDKVERFVDKVRGTPPPAAATTKPTAPSPKKK